MHLPLYRSRASDGLWALCQTRMDSAPDPDRNSHAKVFEGVAKSHFLLKAVVFTSQKRVLIRF